MMPPTDLLIDAGRFGLRWVWVPLLLWTVVAVPLHGAARWARRWDPRIAYRLHLATWWALPIGIGLSAGGITGWLTGGASGAVAAEGAAAPDVWIGALSEGSGGIGGAGGTPIWLLLAGTLTVAAGVAAMVQLARLVYGALQLGRLRRRSRPSPAVSRAARRRAAELGVRRDVEVRLSEEQVGPLTFGWVRPVVVLPESLADAPRSLRLALTHELLHVRGGHYLAGWLEHLLAALARGYPLVPWFRRQLAYFRELACDLEVLEQEDVSARSYARLLYQIADGPGPTRLHALSLSESSTRLIDRIRAMTEQTHSTDRGSGGWNDPRKWGLLLGGIVLAGGALVVACSEMAAPDRSTSPEQAAPEQAATEEGSSDRTVFVAVEEMPEPVGGLRAIQEEISYPEEAREAGIEGRAVVQFVVGHDGQVRDAVISSGVSESIDREALRVVRQTEFEPGRQAGETVPVKMRLPVTFKLGDSLDRSNSAETTLRLDWIRWHSDRLTGRVIIGDRRRPVSGASVWYEAGGEQIGAATHADGEFTIDWPEGEPEPPIQLHLQHEDERRVMRITP